MTTPVKLLLVEDSEDDAEILLLNLRRAGFEVASRRVDHRNDLEAELNNENWEIVITDHNLPGFGSAEVLQITKRIRPDLPVIIVSGTMGEDLAVQAMKTGAQDYIMKNNLARLAPAIERELRESKNRMAHRRAQETIQHLALHDPLTGLSNRNDFESRLKYLLANTSNDVQHALLYIDLDQFKVVNDTCGHMAGDELLRQLAVVMREPIRETDMIARLGGDEFGVLLTNCSLESASQIGERLIEIIRRFRFSWKGETYSIGGSIGLTMIQQDDRSVSDILRRADIACFVAKERGRSRIQVYQTDDDEFKQRHGEMLWVPQLQQAIESNNFQLYVQCIAPVRKENGVHREFLLRLQNSDGEIVAPGFFIPAAERYGLMPDLDRWVVRNAFEYIAEILRLRSSKEAGTYFINLSGATLGDSSFLDYVVALMKQHKILPNLVGFEITETSVIGNLSVAVDFINSVRNLGCHVALDDFGTGLSTFSYLKSIPADFLKIDGSFVRDMLEDPMDTAIVEAINNIGHVAGVRTIAEFVESVGVWQRLAPLGIDYVQGYAVHRPVSINSEPDKFNVAEGPG